MGKKQIIGSQSDQMTPEEKHFKVMGLMTLGFFIKEKKLVVTVAILGIITAFVLTYFILF